MHPLQLIESLFQVWTDIEAENNLEDSTFLKHHMCMLNIQVCCWANLKKGPFEVTRYSD